MSIFYCVQAPSGSNGIEMGQLNAGYNREPEVAFRNGKNGAAAAAAVQNFQRTEPTANGTANGKGAETGTGAETGAEAEASPEAEPEVEVPPFTRTLLRVYGKPLLISQLVMLGYAILLYANPMLLWCATPRPFKTLFLQRATCLFLSEVFYR